MKLSTPIFFVASAVLGYIILNSASLTLWLKIVLVFSVAFLLAGIEAILSYLDEHDYFIVHGKRGM